VDSLGPGLTSRRASGYKNVFGATWCNLVQSGATTDLLIRAGHQCFNAPILPRQLLRRAINHEAHVIEPEPGATESALAADQGRARLDVFETEI